MLYNLEFIAPSVNIHFRRFGSFVYDAWHCPEVAAAISTAAGVDLIPAMDVDVGHVNVSIRTGDAPAQPDDKPAFDWHRDSYPFVCVTMLSDCTGMVGGETALRTGTGEILKVRGPSQVRDQRCSEVKPIQTWD
jgi:hypothetical protein